MKKKILIIGGSGFVGSNIIKKINHNKYIVYATSFRSKKKHDGNVKFFRGNLLNSKFCDRITKSMDIVVMCAAVSTGAKDIENNPMRHVDNNVIMNLNILKVCKKNKVKKFIFLSSNTVYPEGKKSMVETDLNYKMFHKYFNVGWMKIFSEKLCEMYKNDMKIIIVRPANLYGPFDKFDPEKSKVIPSLIRKFENRKIVEVWGDGKDVKDFLYIEDFVDGLIKLINKINRFEIFNISSSKPTSLKKIIFILQKIYSYKKVKISFNKKKPSMIPYRKISNKKFKSISKHKFKFSIEAGLNKTVEWYKKNKDY
tara:strand:- start:2847 stop:3779 length:933 start_codon:yes stop_codon:yes gene_type:complete